MYNLTPEDLDLQARARSLIDEIIPFEEQAEANRPAFDGDTQIFVMRRIGAEQMPEQRAHRHQDLARSGAPAEPG